MQLLKIDFAAKGCFSICCSLAVRSQILREVTTESRMPISPSAAPILLFWGWAEVAMPRLSPQGAYPENGTFSAAQPGLA
ncbi:MAG TPA: hypothetical protein PL187_20985 [Caldilinea sp.]|jgi:hypothetical protein|nr:hypothetical protein [Caldilinea sp.]